jgi:hypothetical protein
VALFLIIMALSIIGFVLHLLICKKPKTKARIVELILLYQLVFNVGLVSFLSFIGFAFFPDITARYIGWPTSPFQGELANVNLAFAVLGILCIWIRGNFWTATILGISIWLLGDALGHIHDVVWNANYAPGNAKVPLFTDIVVPIILLILLVIYQRFEKQNNFQNEVSE